MGQLDFEIDVVRHASGHLVAAYGQWATDAHGLPLTDVSLDGRTFTFVLFGGGAGGGAFKGEILSDGKSMSGEAKAPVGAAPFMLYRTGDAVMPRAIANAAVSAALKRPLDRQLDAGRHLAATYLHARKVTPGTPEGLQPRNYGTTRNAVVRTASPALTSTA